MIDWLGFAKLADLLGELLKKLRSESDRRDNEASAYFQQLSVAMGQVVEHLRKNQIPRVRGNEMNTLIRAFSTKTKGALGAQESVETNTLLAEAADTAKTLDAYVLEDAPTGESEREEGLRILERITGHCRALAGILRKPS